jgi:zinc/manganese transport system substrate-binding protein
MTMTAAAKKLGALSRRLLVISALAAAALSLPATAADQVKVVATFSIIGDFVRAVGGNRVDVETLVGPDGDAHVYSPSPADSRRLADAKLVVTNGLNFEGWISRLIKASGTKARIIEAASGVQPLRGEGGGRGRGHAHGTGHAHRGHADPHAWQSVENAKRYVGNIRDGLIAADPAGRRDYEANAAAYLTRLDELEREVRDAVARIPADGRRLITSHGAFGYFEKAYGLDFIAPQGVSTEAEASAKDVARIIRQIKAQKIKAVFLENISDPRLGERIAKETGARIGGKLYSDALSEAGGPAATYIDMMRHNMRTIGAAAAD